jgi:hypothetical protein
MTCSGDILSLGQRVVAELAKNKGPYAVKTKLVEFVDKGNRLLDRLVKDMAFERKSFVGVGKKAAAHVAQDAPVTVPSEVVQASVAGMQPKELARCNSKEYCHAAAGSGINMASVLHMSMANAPGSIPKIREVQANSLRERECCLLVLNLVSSTLPCIRQPRP